MSVLAVIPARAGSKGVPGKNLQPVGGRTLVQRAVEVCRRSDLVDAVAVSSDGPEILAAATGAGAIAIDRPVELAGDTASSESALLHAIRRWGEIGNGEPDVVVFVQCTSPFIDPADLDRAVRKVTTGECDVVFSAVESHTFLWRTADDGAVGVNHDAAVRLRRQDRHAEFAETGAFYVMATRGFVEAGHRFFGRVLPQLVPDVHRFEIDAPSDLRLVRHLARVVDPLPPVRPGLSEIDAVVMDFDGVHTDNTATVDETGRESVRVNRSDGLGIAALRRRGTSLLILSTEKNPVVQRRAEKLGVPCLAGQDDKRAALEAWAAEAGIAPERILYIGNDANDHACLDWVGWPIVVADAHPSVRALARRTTDLPGGAGAVREVIDWLLDDGHSNEAHEGEAVT